jgi:hypothetical protein
VFKHQHVLSVLSIPIYGLVVEWKWACCSVPPLSICALFTVFCEVCMHVYGLCLRQINFDEMRECDWATLCSQLILMKLQLTSCMHLRSFVLCEHVLFTL